MGPGIFCQNAVWSNGGEEAGHFSRPTAERQFLRSVGRAGVACARVLRAESPLPVGNGAGREPTGARARPAGPFSAGPARVIGQKYTEPPWFGIDRGGAGDRGPDAGFRSIPRTMARTQIPDVGWRCCHRKLV